MRLGKQHWYANEELATSLTLTRSLTFSYSLSLSLLHSLLYLTVYLPYTVSLYSFKSVSTPHLYPISLSLTSPFENPKEWDSLTISTASIWQSPKTTFFRSEDLTSLLLSFSHWWARLRKCVSQLFLNLMIVLLEINVCVCVLYFTFTQRQFFLHQTNNHPSLAKICELTCVIMIITLACTQTHTHSLVLVGHVCLKCVCVGVCKLAWLHLKLNSHAI